MKLNTHHFSFNILEQTIESMYHRLRVSASAIFKLVDEEINFKNIYSPKNGYIVETYNKKEFEIFQETLRNLNNIVYFNSLLLGSYSIFETSFKHVCAFVEKHSNSNLDPFNPDRKILQYCRQYLSDSKLVDFTRKEFDSRYTYLTEVNDLRNLIAHYNGNLIKEKGKSIQHQPDYKKLHKKYLTIMNNGQVFINDDEYIKKFIKTSEGFIKLIIKEFKNNSNVV